MAQENDPRHIFHLFSFLVFYFHFSRIFNLVSSFHFFFRFFMSTPPPFLFLFSFDLYRSIPSAGKIYAEKHIRHFFTMSIRKASCGVVSMERERSRKQKEKEEARMRIMWKGNTEKVVLFKNKEIS